ncbi:hypothetical protein, partial [Pseudonocardia sp. UM4_GMWB1]|uniref:hypothetical protein n=1 Tax=Pseudonocardia sp. UM4_GMWB1 TaxID=2212989 RepID=UPI00307EB7AF
MSTSETRTDTPAARVPAPRRADRGERWTERLGWRSPRTGSPGSAEGERVAVPPDNSTHTDL